MFDNLSSGLEKAWDIVRKDGKLTADNIKGPMREIRRALLEADVSCIIFTMAHHLPWRRISCTTALQCSSDARGSVRFAWMKFTRCRWVDDCAKRGISCR